MFIDRERMPFGSSDRLISRSSNRSFRFRSAEILKAPCLPSVRTASNVQGCHNRRSVLAVAVRFICAASPRMGAPSKISATSKFATSTATGKSGSVGKTERFRLGIGQRILLSDGQTRHRQSFWPSGPAPQDARAAAQTGSNPARRLQGSATPLDRRQLSSDRMSRAN